MSAQACGLRPGALALCAVLMTGCAAGTPFEDAAGPSTTTVAGKEVDATPTGSITPASDNPLDQVLAQSDHAAVLTALGASLDPQSPGLTVTWTAAGGQGRGDVKPTATARVIGDDVCRPFALAGVGVAGKFTASGLACRNKRGDWRVRELTPGKSA